PESEKFAAQLVEAVGWTRTLLLLNFRPEYGAEWMLASYYQPLALAPLTSEDTDTLLCDLVSDAPSIADVRALIKERAAGNPHFVEEIVRSLVDQGVLVRDAPARRAGTQPDALNVRLARDVTELQIPATVQSVLAARIDALAEPAKRVLQAAAVIGKRFSEPVLRLSLEAPAPRPDHTATAPRHPSTAHQPAD